MQPERKRPTPCLLGKITPLSLLRPATQNKHSQSCDNSRKRRDTRSNLPTFPTFPPSLFCKGPIRTLLGHGHVFGPPQDQGGGRVRGGHPGPVSCNHGDGKRPPITASGREADRFLKFSAASSWRFSCPRCWDPLQNPQQSRRRHHLVLGFAPLFAAVPAGAEVSVDSSTASNCLEADWSRLVLAVFLLVSPEESVPRWLPGFLTQ